jgi:hypothetical protein
VRRALLILDQKHSTASRSSCLVEERVFELISLSMAAKAGTGVRYAADAGRRATSVANRKFEAVVIKRIDRAGTRDGDADRKPDIRTNAVQHPP